MTLLLKLEHQYQKHKLNLKRRCTGTATESSILFKTFSILRQIKCFIAYMTSKLIPNNSKRLFLSEAINL